MMSNLSWKYVKMLKNAKSVEDFENSSGLMLPEDMKAFLKINNGGRPSKHNFDTERSKGRVMKSLLSFNETDVETIYDAMNALKKEKAYLVPFASDPAGNYICYNTRNQEIVLWLHETDTLERIAESFTEFTALLY